MTISKKGNAVGFTSDGFTITGQWLSGRKAWMIMVCSGINGAPSQTEPRNRSFPTLADAKVYAASMIDQVQTQKLAWWAL